MITTRIELDALPEGTVILDRDAVVFRRQAGVWEPICAGDRENLLGSEAVPAVVVEQPAPEPEPVKINHTRSTWELRLAEARAETMRLREKLVWQEAEIARLVIDRDQARQENAQVMADYTDPTPTIASVINQCGEAAEKNGWHERYRMLESSSRIPPAILEHLVSKTALIGCEVSEAIEELRDGHEPDEVYESEGGKPEGYGVELADVVIRVFDLAWMLNLDLPGLIDQKLEANQRRGRLHGGKRI